MKHKTSLKDRIAIFLLISYALYIIGYTIKTIIDHQ